MREKKPVTLMGRAAIASRIVLAVLLASAILAPAARAQEGEPDPLEGWDGVIAPATHQGSHEVIVVPRDSATCGQPFTFTYTTFEHPQAFIDLQNIHPADGFIIPGSGMEFNANWITRETPPASFAGNPSGRTATAWLSGPFAEVNFQEPVSGVSLFYASFTSVTLETYDATGNLVGSPSEGAATGGFRHWQRLSVLAGRRIITRARLFGRVRGVFVDDLGTCGGPLEVDIDIKPGSDPNSINLGAAGVVPVAILSSDTFDATTVDPDTVSLAGAAVKMMGKSNRFLCHAEDVNADGRLDLICQVENLTYFLLDAGQTIAVLEAFTFDGLPIRGQDTVNIVPDP